MATISTHLRSFKEPTKDELNRLFFSLPQEVTLPTSSSGQDVSNAEGGAGGSMDINAVLSLGPDSTEDSYVRRESA